MTPADLNVQPDAATPGTRISRSVPLWILTTIAIAGWAIERGGARDSAPARLSDRPGASRRRRMADEELAHEADQQTAVPPLVSWRGVWELTKITANKWLADKAPQLGASLAYYTVFSLVPLLIVVIAIAGMVFGQQAAEGQIVEELAGLVGQQSAQAVETMIEKARNPTAGAISAILAVITLLFGASGVFGQMQDALNTIWGVEPKPGLGIWGTLRQRFLSFVAVMGTAFLLLVSLVISAAMATLGDAMPSILPAPEFVLEGLNMVLSLAVTTALFAMMFKLLPDAHIAWRDVGIGAFITAVLFTIGKFAIGYYLGKSDVASTYGAAGSVVVILVWVYYSSQLMLLGAEFTAVYASRYGSHIAPTEHAVAVAEPAISG